MKTTAVEWFYKTIINDPLGDWEYYFKQAKEMEKQQIIDAYDKGQENPFEYSEDNEVNYYDGNNYYNETFKK